jgi:hypothetical protein
LWILNALKESSDILNNDNESGIAAYRKEKQLQDGKFYEYHFINRKDGNEISHIGATRPALEDSFNHRGEGVIEKLRQPLTYDLQKLDILCNKILDVLQNREGVFRLENNSNITQL